MCDATKNCTDQQLGHKNYVDGHEAIIANQIADQARILFSSSQVEKVGNAFYK